jgi:hypothetical protein
MKNYILIIIVWITIFNNATAQTFLKENKIWCISEFLDGETQPKTIYYKFEGTALVNSISYKKVFYSYSTDNWITLDWVIREDSNKVYYNNYSNSSGEHILYDFNLNVGDKYQPWQLEIPVVIDSIVVKNIFGTERKYWYFSFSEVIEGTESINVEVWIEGIGSFTGPLTPFGKLHGGGIYELLCVHEDNIQIYQNSAYTSCDANSNAVPILENRQQLIDLYSTGNGMLRLQLINKEMGEITLFNMEGKQLLNRKITNTETELSAPINGLLLYRYINKKGETQTGKVLVK